MASGSKSPSTALRVGDRRVGRVLWDGNGCDGKERCVLWGMMDRGGWCIGWDGVRRLGENAKAWDTTSAASNNLVVVMAA